MHFDMKLDANHRLERVIQAELFHVQINENTVLPSKV